MDRAGVRTVGLCGLALRNLPYFRFYRKGICGQYAVDPVRRGCTFYDVYRSFRYQLSGVHAAVYSLHRGGNHDSARIRLSAEDSWGRDDAVLRGMDRGSCCLYLGGDPVMHLLDWALLVLIAAAAITAILHWRKKARSGSGCCGDCSHCKRRCS